jgi:hypothetical protein
MAVDDVEKRDHPQPAHCPQTFSSRRALSAIMTTLEVMLRISGIEECWGISIPNQDFR